MRKQAGVDFVQTALAGLSKGCHMAKNEIPGNSGNPAFLGNLTTVRLRMTRYKQLNRKQKATGLLRECSCRGMICLGIGANSIIFRFLAI